MSNLLLIYYHFSIEYCNKLGLSNEVKILVSSHYTSLYLFFIR